MDQPHQLLDLFRLWREFTEAEGAAIRVGDWPKVESCQNSKFQLQQQMTVATTQLDPVDFLSDTQFRRNVNDLILMEQANDRALADQRTELELRRAELGQTARNLNRLQQSYRSPRGAAWQSYS